MGTCDVNSLTQGRAKPQRWKELGATHFGHPSAHRQTRANFRQQGQPSLNPQSGVNTGPTPVAPDHLPGDLQLIRESEQELRWQTGMRDVLIRTQTCDVHLETCQRGQRQLPSNNGRVCPSLSACFHLSQLCASKLTTSSSERRDAPPERMFCRHSPLRHFAIICGKLCVASWAFDVRCEVVFHVTALSTFLATALGHDFHRPLLGTFQSNTSLFI